MTSTAFGQRLRRLRLATTVTESPRADGVRWAQDRPLSCQRLARLAQLDMAYVQYLEAGTRHPSSAVVERICAALACTARERATLLVAAGYWPWTAADDEVTELLVALALAVLDGDYRPLEQTGRETSTMGATMDAR